MRGRGRGRGRGAPGGNQQFQQQQHLQQQQGQPPRFGNPNQPKHMRPMHPNQQNVSRLLIHYVIYSQHLSLGRVNHIT